MIWTIMLWLGMPGCFVINDHMICNSIEVHEGSPAIVWETPSEPNAAILLPPKEECHKEPALDGCNTLTICRDAHGNELITSSGLSRCTAPTIILPTPYVTKPPKPPIEHIFEVKTERKPTGLTEMCSMTTFTSNPSCTTILTPTYCPDGNFCKEIVDITRELWMDGKRLGVIKGLD